jgi:hypothetical protein
VEEPVSAPASPGRPGAQVGLSPPPARPRPQAPLGCPRRHLSPAALAAPALRAAARLAAVLAALDRLEAEAEKAPVAGLVSFPASWGKPGAPVGRCPSRGPLFSPRRRASPAGPVEPVSRTPPCLPSAIAGRLAALPELEGPVTPRIGWPTSCRPGVVGAGVVGRHSFPATAGRAAVMAQASPASEEATAEPGWLPAARGTAMVSATAGAAVVPAVSGVVDRESLPEMAGPAAAPAQARPASEAATAGAAVVPAALGPVGLDFIPSPEARPAVPASGSQASRAATVLAALPVPILREVGRPAPVVAEVPPPSLEVRQSPAEAPPGAPAAVARRPATQVPMAREPEPAPAALEPAPAATRGHSRPLMTSRPVPCWPVVCHRNSGSRPPSRGSRATAAAALPGMAAARAETEFSQAAAAVLMGMVGAALTAVGEAVLLEVAGAALPAVAGLVETEFPEAADRRMAVPAMPPAGREAGPVEARHPAEARQPEETDPSPRPAQGLVDRACRAAPRGRPPAAGSRACSSDRPAGKPEWRAPPARERGRTRDRRTRRRTRDRPVPLPADPGRCPAAKPGVAAEARHGPRTRCTTPWLRRRRRNRRSRRRNGAARGR